MGAGGHHHPFPRLQLSSTGSSRSRHRTYDPAPRKKGRPASESPPAESTSRAAGSFILHTHRKLLASCVRVGDRREGKKSIRIRKQTHTLSTLARRSEGQLELFLALDVVFVDRHQAEVSPATLLRRPLESWPLAPQHQQGKLGSLTASQPCTAPLPHP